MGSGIKPVSVNDIRLTEVTDRGQPMRIWFLSPNAWFAACDNNPPISSELNFVFEFAGRYSLNRSTGNIYQWMAARLMLERCITMSHHQIGVDRIAPVLEISPTCRGACDHSSEKLSSWRRNVTYGDGAVTLSILQST